ncbi:N-alpha-acetyltransferase 20 [Cucumispora dikerogammari]|nr:N-alpha-acetyltransferase 20 [Cucumispora dikerogammari]
MYEILPFLPEHVFALDLCNLDKYTESFTLDFYLYYLLNHSNEMYVVSYTNSNTYNFNNTSESSVIAYIIGLIKEESRFPIKTTNDKVLKTHISALSINASERNYGWGKLLISLLEGNGRFVNSEFCDLYVKVNNSNAIRFYKKMGYYVYRTVFEYYTMPVCDAFDMRKYFNHSKQIKGTDIRGDAL